MSRRNRDRSPAERRGRESPRERRDRSPARRRKDSPKRRDDSRDSGKRGSPIYGKLGDSPRERRRRVVSFDSNSDRDDRKSPRRDERRGGKGDQDDMVHTMNKIFKDLIIVHEMIKNETEGMRGHRSMSRSKKDYKGEARLNRRLKEGRSPADTLNNLAKNVKEVKKYLNEDYRQTFFDNICGDGGSKRGRGDREERNGDREDRNRDRKGGSGRRDRHRDGDSGDRDRGRGDRDRGDRDRPRVRDRRERGERTRGSRRAERAIDDRDGGRRDDRNRDRRR